MSVFYWKPRNRWCVQWTEDGKKKRRYFTTEQEARAADQERRLPEEQQRLTLGELVLLYFRSNPHKHENYRKVMAYFLYGREAKGRHVEGAGEFMRRKYAEALTRFDLERMRENVRANGSCNNSINKYQAYISAILTWGADQELISHNPWRSFKKLPITRHIVTTTIADIRAAYASAPPWLQWAIKTMYALSLRPGRVELFGLLWTAFNWRHGYVQYAQGKSGRVKRVVPPPAYWMEARRRFEEDSSAGVPWVCHRLGRKVNNYRSAWDRAKKKAGFSGRCIRPYDIRHAAASEMLAAGADLAAVAAQMGHASIQTTATTYAHVTPGGQKRAADLLPSLVQFGAEKSPHD